jgi:hypothetical protein
MATIPSQICIDNNETIYYNSKELQKYDPLFYWGCKTKPRNIIKKRKICESEYLFANLKMGKWNISSATCKKSQLLISKKWVEENMKSMNEKYNNDLNRKIFYDEIPLETIQLLEKIKELEYELERVKNQHCNDVEQERCENQFLQLQLENNIQFSKLKEEKYLLQIQMLQNK